ncbi:MAG TPA: HPF/RaiA family ribosome-associated protein [Candidatus Binatia bacterium]|jgi:cold shock CspA family protein
MESMNFPLQITFRNMPPSEMIERKIRRKVGKLEQFYRHIVGCRVVVEAPHRHHRKGKSFVIRIDLALPGKELVISNVAKPLRAAKVSEQESENVLAKTHEPSKAGAHEDVYVAIRDAFNAADRKLQDYARRRSGALKIHKTSPRARVSRIFSEDGYGFLETADGKQVYFHGHSVLRPGFNRLKIGTEVQFIEAEGNDGPQASTVRMISPRSKSRQEHPNV